MKRPYRCSPTKRNISPKRRRKKRQHKKQPRSQKPGNGSAFAFFATLFASGESPATLKAVNPELQLLFAEEYRALRPRAPIPSLEVRFRRFTSLNTTIRLREGRVHVHLSDLLEGAPESVLRAIAHILLAKLYRKPLNAVQTARYRRFASSEAVMRQTELIRQSRGRKKMLGPKGQHYDLNEIFESLNGRFFHGL